MARELTDLISRRGKPGMIVSDHGTEFTSNAILAWSKDHRVEWRYIAPGKPTDNGFIEAFNSKLRAECLNAHWFMDLADAREKLEDWRKDYNEVRTHRSIGYNVPIDLHNPSGATSPSP